MEENKIKNEKSAISSADEESGELTSPLIFKSEDSGESVNNKGEFDRVVDQISHLFNTISLRAWMVQTKIKLPSLPQFCSKKGKNSRSQAQQAKNDKNGTEVKKIVSEAPQRVFRPMSSYGRMRCPGSAPPAVEFKPYFPGMPGGPSIIGDQAILSPSDFSMDSDQNESEDNYSEISEEDEENEYDDFFESDKKCFKCSRYNRRF